MPDAISLIFPQARPRLHCIHVRSRSSLRPEPSQGTLFEQGAAMQRLTGRFALLAVAALMVLTGTAQAAELIWWSHWATQDTKKVVLEEVRRRFEAKHPGDRVTITYYEKQNMWPTLRAAFTAGSGFP